MYIQCNIKKPYEFLAAGLSKVCQQNILGGRMINVDVMLLNVHEQHFWIIASIHGEDLLYKQGMVGRSKILPILIHATYPC